MTETHQYKISQKDTTNQINIRITNQDIEEITASGDWFLTMQLERHDKDVTKSLLRQIKEYISCIFFNYWYLFIVKNILS